MSAALLAGWLIVTYNWCHAVDFALVYDARHGLDAAGIMRWAGERAPNGSYPGDTTHRDTHPGADHACCPA